MQGAGLDQARDMRGYPLEYWPSHACVAVSYGPFEPVREVLAAFGSNLRHLGPRLGNAALSAVDVVAVFAMNRPVAPGA